MCCLHLQARRRMWGDPEVRLDGRSIRGCCVPARRSGIVVRVPSWLLRLAICLIIHLVVGFYFVSFGNLSTTKQKRAVRLDGSDSLVSLLFQVTGPAHIPWQDPVWQELLHGYNVWVHCSPDARQEFWNGRRSPPSSTAGARPIWPPWRCT